MLVYQWANDPTTRSLSYSTDPIPLNSHMEWFNKKIGSEDCVYLILLVDDIPAGQLRYDIKKNDFIISFGIDPAFRKKGLGTAILKLGENYLTAVFSESRLTLIGYVKNNNIPSLISFERNGYVREEANQAEYPDSSKFIKRINESI